MESLVLSSNYLSCKAVRMDAATQLGKGEYPGIVGVMESIFLSMGDNMVTQGLMYYNPFNDVRFKHHESAVLVFAGNMLTTDSSVLPAQDANNLLKQDEIMQGRKSLFEGGAHTDTDKLTRLIQVTTR